MERDKMKTDLSSLFMPRQPAMGSEEAVSKDLFTLSKSDVASRWVLKKSNLLFTSGGSRD